jgi:hypothetical protein
MEHTRMGMRLLLAQAEAESGGVDDRLGRVDKRRMRRKRWPTQAPHTVNSQLVAAPRRHVGAADP